MLPGVESARRRRFHHGGSLDQPSGSRRLAYGLYTTSHETTHISSNSMQRSGLNDGGALGNIAREAKERLDERLRSQRSSEIKRHNSTGSMRTTESGGGGGGEGVGALILGNAQREELYTKRCSRRFSWTKLSWKSSDQVECVVCLEEFKTGNILVHLPCGHRFHWSCVVPWLESNSHCPCCRMTVHLDREREESV